MLRLKTPHSLKMEKADLLSTISGEKILTQWLCMFQVVQYLLRSTSVADSDRSDECVLATQFIMVLSPFVQTLNTITVVRLKHVQVEISKYMYICIHMRMYIYIHIYRCIYISHLYTYIHHMYHIIYTSYVSIYIHIYIYIYTYILCIPHLVYQEYILYLIYPDH